MKSLNTLLIVAGSDPSCGAGLGADIRVASRLGVYPCFVVSTLTTQNTVSVKGSYTIPSSHFKSQLEYLLDDISPQAVKIGLLPNPISVRILAGALKKVINKTPQIPIVFDPVTVSSSGVPLTSKSTRKALISNLFPLCTLVTPNLNEATHLAEAPLLTGEPDLLCEKLLSLGCSAVLLTGGENPYSKRQTECQDLLYQKFDSSPKKYSALKVNTKNSHGTGCLLSTAIASFMAKGNSLEKSVEKAKEFTTQSLTRSQSIHLGQGRGPAFINTYNNGEYQNEL